MPKTHSNTLVETVEIVSFFQTLAPKKVLSRFLNSGDRAFSLYPIIANSRKLLADEEVMKAAAMTLPQYQRALSKVKSALLEAILDLDLSQGNYSDLAQRLYVLDLAHARVRILERFSATYSANAEAKTWLKEATSLEQWRRALSSLSPMLNWASLSGNREEFDRL